MSVPPIDIAEEDWAIVRDILHRHVPDHAVWAFGSRVKRTARRFSDLDLAIITDTPLPFDVGGALREDFSESDLPFRVDTLDWVTTSEAFRRRVEQDKVAIQPAGPDSVRSPG